MNQPQKSLTIGLTLICFASCTGIVAAQTQIAHRVRVILDAQEADVRTSVANLDIYSIRVQPKSGPAFEGIAPDRYPNYEQGLPTALIGQDRSISVKLRRTPYCDRGGEKRNDRVALPCFTVVHGSWKMPKDFPEDQWWK